MYQIKRIKTRPKLMMDDDIIKDEIIRQDKEIDNKIQIWCPQIVKLLITVIRKMKKKWSFSNLASDCRLHLLNCILLLKF
jgi:hypothetical protein